MLKKIAIMISFGFHPMIISFGIFIILVFSNIELNTNPNLILLSCFIFSNFIPILTVLFLKKYGVINDLDASIKDQRKFPLFLGVLYSASGFVVVNILDANQLTQGLMFCYTTNTILTLIITHYWKISIHAIGVSAPLAALFLNGNYYPIMTMLIILAVCWSRVTLKSHTIAQVIAGSGFGFFGTLFQLRWLFL